ncbi:MAG: CPBP family intramembrane metalloprotease [Kiritimatiellae bacterium]|nr:CPBP family intramembrane metalloprotease [Kiritimatiellia bacterium]
MKRTLGIILLLVWPLYLNDLYLIALGDAHPGVLWTLDVLFFLVIPVITIVCLAKSRVISLREVGFPGRVSVVSVLAGVGVCALLIVVDRWQLHWWLRSVFPARLHPGYEFPEAQPLRGIVIVYAALTAGFLEELVYRGILTTELKKHIRSTTLVVVLSGLIFGGIHWGEGIAAVLDTFAWSLILAVWYVKRRRLWGPITCHVLYDLLIFSGVI